MKLFKKWRCEHDYEFVRNIYGDAINWCGGYRSVWRCKKCGKIEYRYYLQQNTICEKLNDLYDEYYKNKYEEWCALRSETLNNMLQEMINLAKKGQCQAEFILFCEVKHNDKNYYDRWFNENKLKTEIILNQEQECTELNQYIFKVKWKYN